MFNKFASLSYSSANAVKLSAIDEDDPSLIEHFKKATAALKAIAPKANDFLYFTAIMMHAAEASLIDDDGNLRKTADGKDVEAKWEKTKNGGIAWICTDSSIKPYRNNNHDIFGEDQLKIAHKLWVGKPLCIDHQSQSVDHIRGVIVDTVYDEKFKRVIALCALDKKSYPELARKVTSGYSASVSMGTAVAEAICTECAVVARVESEFCDHMRYKTCYGEINVGLSPIELSIVVNPADPKARIRRIIASAGSVAKYVEQDCNNHDPRILMLKNELKTKIAQLTKELEVISGDNETLDKEGEEISLCDVRPGSGPIDMKEEILPNTADNLQAGSTNRYASLEELAVDLKDNISQIDNIINKMALDKSDKSIDKTINKDTTMANQKSAYFQGGGGVNEPARGQVKYPIDPAQDQIRNKDDKQMQGESPFPGVGSVDGLYPGDEAVKKEIQRLAAEKAERQIRRQAALDHAKLALEKSKEAYFQGGGDVNEPTRGKAKYPVDPAQEQIRNKDDKQLQGEKPFPGVGLVDGLYPGDEAVKKEIQRAAKLSARFVKAAKSDGSDDLANSRWDIYAKADGKAKLILTATVEELAGKEKVGSLFPLIATEDYAKQIISTIRTAGLDKAKSIFKGAQDVPAVAGPGAEVAAPVDAGGPAALPASPEYAGEAGDPAEQIGNLVGELGNLQADLAKASEALTEDKGETPAVEGMPAEMPRIAKVLRDGLMKESLASIGKIKDSIDELKMIQTVYKEASTGDKGIINILMKDAIAEARSFKSEAKEVMASFVRYAQSKDILMKKAQTAQIKPGQGNYSLNPNLIPVPESAAALIKMNMSPGAFDAKYVVVPDEKLQYDAHHSVPTDLGYAADATSAKQKLPQSVADTLKGTVDLGKYQVVSDEEYHKSTNSADDCGYAAATTEKATTHTTEKCSEKSEKSSDENKADVAPTTSKENLAPALRDLMPVGHPKTVDVPEVPDKPLFNLNDVGNVDADFDPASGKITMDIKNASREERDTYRAKLAQKGLQFAEMLSKINPSVVVPGLDTKPSDDLGKVENVKDQHEKIMSKVTAPLKVREAAETIQALVIRGEINPATDFPGLIAEGVDSAAISYWKSFYGEAKDKESSQFASDLVKGFAEKKKAASDEQLKVKVARAYEVASDMARRGLISSEPSSLRSQAEALMNHSDEDFEHFKNTVAKVPMATKQASLPMVGMTSLPELPAAQPSTVGDLKSELDLAFSTSTRVRNF